MSALPLPDPAPPPEVLPDKTLRIGSAAHEKLTAFVKAFELQEFVEERRVRRVSQSEAIEWLLDQPAAQEMLARFEEARALRQKSRNL